MKHDLPAATMGLLEPSLVQRSMPSWYSSLPDDDDEMEMESENKFTGSTPQKLAENTNGSTIRIFSIQFQDFKIRRRHILVTRYAQAGCAACRRALQCFSAGFQAHQ